MIRPIDPSMQLVTSGSDLLPPGVRKTNHRVKGLSGGCTSPRDLITTSHWLPLHKSFVAMIGLCHKEERSILQESDSPFLVPGCCEFRHVFQKHVIVGPDVACLS